LNAKSRHETDMSNSENNYSNRLETAESLYADTPAVAIQVSRDVVVASIQVDLEQHVMARFQQDLLQRIHASGASGAILDLSGLDTIDCEEFTALRKIITMTAIMGAECVLVGLRPGVVSSLIEAGADVDGLRAAINLDAAYAMLQPEPEAEPPDAPDKAVEASVTEQENAQSAVDILPWEEP
jgi:rsbT antagonist protein RsbS